jgi:hypothetical protein
MLRAGWYPLKPAEHRFPCVGLSCRGRGGSATYVEKGQLRSGRYNDERKDWDAICSRCYEEARRVEGRLACLADEGDLVEDEAADSDDEELQDDHEPEEQLPEFPEEEQGSSSAAAGGGGSSAAAGGGGCGVGSFATAGGAAAAALPDLVSSRREPPAAAPAAGLSAGGAAAAASRRFGRNIVEEPPGPSSHQPPEKFSRSETQRKLHELLQQLLRSVPRPEQSGSIRPANDGTTHKAFLERHRDTAPEVRFAGPLTRAEAVLAAAALDTPPEGILEAARWEFAVHSNVSALLILPEVFYYEQCRHDPCWMVQPNAVAGTGGAGVRMPCPVCRSNKCVMVGRNGWNMTKLDRVRIYHHFKHVACLDAIV